LRRGPDDSLARRTYVRLTGLDDWKIESSSRTHLMSPTQTITPSFRSKPPDSPTDLRLEMCVCGWLKLFEDSSSFYQRCTR